MSWPHFYVMAGEIHKSIPNPKVKNNLMSTVLLVWRYKLEEYATVGAILYLSIKASLFNFKVCIAAWVHLRTLIGIATIVRLLKTILSKSPSHQSRLEHRHL